MLGQYLHMLHRLDWSDSCSLEQCADSFEKVSPRPVRLAACCKLSPGPQACVALAVLPVCDEWPAELQLETEGKPLDQTGIQQCET